MIIRRLLTKYSILVLLLCLISEVAALAVTAYPKPHKIIQPDGTSIMLMSHGHEFFHYFTTADGTVVSKCADGFYRPTGSDAKAMMAKAATRPVALQPIRGPRQQVAGKDYRGLVILVNFNDRQFSRGDDKALTFYNKLMNYEGSFPDFDEYYGPQKYTGSVRQYFSDNSNGLFVPSFDVVGPVNIDVSQYYINGIEHTYDLAEQVLRSVDNDIDYSRYDSDGDGVVDMVYFLYAGYASSYQGNDERLIWPHAGDMSNVKPLTLDGRKIGRFAASAEIFGWHEDGDLLLDGIGVIVHEFSHVLGFMDHYDTSNGYQEHPNAWDVMSAGNYSEDANRTPCGFNSFEKWAAGFSAPLDITDMDGSHITLQQYDESADACLIRSYQDHVSYFMENRQNSKWDKYLPGHGLLVWRVDSVRPEYWQNNCLNVTTRACFRLVRACGTQGSFFTGVVDTDYDSFPGTHGITELDNDEDDANLLSYDYYPCPVVLRNIAETDGVITFDVEYDGDADNRPFTFALPETFYAKGEKKDGDSWVPATWTVTTRVTDEKKYIYNLLPNTDGITSTNRDYSDGIYFEYTYASDVAHTINLNAQRVALNDDYGVWLSDINNVYQQGSGAFAMSVSRYGIPAIMGDDVTLAYCRQTPKAYLVSQKNIVEQLSTYRNIVFSETMPEVDGITEQHHDAMPSLNRKVIENGRILILNNGRKYSLSGQILQ